MTIGKKRAVRVVVNIEAVTNLDDFTLEQRFNTFIDPHRFRAESLDPKEYIRFLHTRIDHQALGGQPEVTMNLPLVEPASDGMKLQVIKGLVEGIKGSYSHPDDLERVVLEAFGRIAKIVE